MKKILLLLFLALPLAAAERSVTLALDDAYIATYRAYLSDRHPEADTDRDGSVSSTEALAWVELQAQSNLEIDTVRAVLWAEQNDPSVLPQDHRSALANKQLADTAIEEQRGKISRASRRR